MHKSLNVVEGTNGLFCDVAGRPIVVIFDAQEARARAREKRQKKNVRLGVSPSSSGLVFVNSSGLNDKDEETKRRIRSHVQRRFKQEEKKQTKPKMSQLAMEDLGKELFIPASVEMSSFPSWQVNGNLDPFASYPIPMRPDTYKLIHRYLSVVVQATYPKDAITEQGCSRLELFELAMTDAALFHMVLCGSVLYVDILSGQPESTEALVHKIAAIRNINGGLQHNLEVSDAMVAAVTYLAKVEVVLGNLISWNIHMNGLMKMIESRGGLRQLPLTLQGKVCMADLTGCLESDLTPRYPMFDSTPAPPITLAKVPSSQMCVGFQSMATIYCLDAELISILHHVHNFSEYINLPTTARIASDPQEVDGIAANLRHRLLCYRAVCLSTADSQNIGECCRLGALVFLRIILQVFPRRSTPSGGILLDKLRHCIGFIETWNRSSTVNLLIWTCFIGSIASASGVQRDWFISRFSAITQTSGIATMDELRLRLEQFMSINKIHGCLLFTLWAEGRDTTAPGKCV